MNLLEGSIAFALALAGLATLCTVLVEILHRLLQLRADGLEKMLQAYFDRELRPLLDKAKAGGSRKDLLDTLTQNALLEAIHPESTATGGFLGRFLGRLAAIYRKPLARVTEVTTEQFLERLPDTKLFKELARSENEARILLKDLADRYDHYGAAASDYFKRRAQLVSLVMGIALAVFGNIQGIRIFDTFIKNPEVAQAMIDQTDAIKAQVYPTAKPLENTAPTTDADQLAQVTARLKQVESGLEEYKAIGLPIGWGYYPNCMVLGAKDSRCQALGIKPDQSGERCTLGSVLRTFGRDIGAAVLWFCTVVLTGLLIGLGGPFWFDLAMRLSQVKQAFSGGQTASSAPAATATPQTPRQDALDKAAAKLPPAQGKAPWDDKPW